MKKGKEQASSACQLDSISDLLGPFLESDPGDHLGKSNILSKEVKNVNQKT
jgi:hypothetical protein